VAQGTTSSSSGVSLAPCDQNISTGPHTSCGFAANVFRAYAANYQANGQQSSVTVTASSAATGQSYSVVCNLNSGTVDCTTSTGAFVTFPMQAVVVYKPV
jgi:hypothetical protein